MNSQELTNLWLARYVNDSAGVCGLCGNTGRINTLASAKTFAGLWCGIVADCICPNGQVASEFSVGKLAVVKGSK